MGGIDMCKVECSFYVVMRRASSPSTVPVRRRTEANFSNFPGAGQGSLSEWSQNPIC